MSFFFGDDVAVVVGDDFEWNSFLLVEGVAGVVPADSYQVWLFVSAKKTKK